MAAIVASIPLQIICQLIATGSPSVTLESSTSAPNQPPLQTEPFIQLPDGYVAYPDIGVAYKVHNESVLWKEGRRRCILDGGNLAVIDSVKKLEYVSEQRQSKGVTHVGLHSLFDEDEWVSVKTGLPVPNIPWGPSEPTPNGGAYCAMVKSQSSGLGLGNFGCNIFRGDFVCEIPSPVKEAT